VPFMRYSGCVILIAFPLQLSFHELASMLRFTYIVYLVTIYSKSIYLLFNPWRGVRLEKLAVSQLVKKFPALYTT